MLVKLPIIAQCTTRDPATKPTEVPALEKWIADLQHHKTTDAYKKAVKLSQPAASLNHKRLSLQIWEAHGRLWKGKELAEKRDSKEIKWDDLDKTEQDLLEAYDTDKLDKNLRDLLSQKTPPEKRYKGAAAYVAEENTDGKWRQKRDWPGFSSRSKKIKKGSAPPPAATV